MSVKYLIDDIAEKAKGFSRTRILRMINDGQNYLFSKPCRQTIYLESTTGFPPTLTTVAGTYKYSAPACSKTIGGTTYNTLRMSKIVRVFVDISEISNYTIKYLGQPFQFQGTNPYTDTTDKLYFAEVPCESYDALENDNAYLMFRSDPGASTGIYYVEGLIEPLQLTAETIPLTIPKRWEDALFDYVVGKIEDQNYGADSRTARWHDFWAPKIWSEQSAGSPSSPHAGVFL